MVEGALVVVLAQLMNPVMAEVNETKRELLIENVLLRALLLSMNDQEMFEPLDWFCSGQACNVRNRGRVDGNIRKLYEGSSIGTAVELTEFEVNSIGDHTHFRIYKEIWIYLNELAESETRKYECSSKLIVDKFERKRKMLVSCPAIVKTMVEDYYSTSLKMLNKVHEEEGHLCGYSKRFSGCLKWFSEVYQ
ncbi:hypothetical protein [Candidatus Reidiella endopervernicosa]|uniref:Uncharacterized protein n=1 Tax=Candidatus Reidiella endopervernicosa TaxID=2738883 RepID=A0A6N0HYR5_9GAMM|nr:hypothetical protein [Candidatus Reidiella endopervernicosa]QKQ27489.1 hypothetical protein HUE57_15260 [Candidatus Reidiella endopervernicosa]